jgi:DNA polymerase-4
VVERLIAHVDMDAFFAAVEVRDHPEYRGRPVVVGAGPHARGVVAAASYEARRYGIHSAMPSRRAFALCPGAVFLPPDMARYRAESERVFDLLETFTPQIEPVSVDEAFLDLTGCPVPAGHASSSAEPGLAFGQAIQRRIRARLGLPASVGVAPNKFLAKVASELAKPDGVRRIMPDAVQSVLDPLPVEALWGVGPETRARLQARRIATVGALRRTPVSALRAILGFPAERLVALSRGKDDRPVDPGGEAKSIGREVTFDHDTRDRDLLARTLRAACEDVAHRLRADGVAGRVVTLKVRFEPFETRTRRLTLPAATDHGGRLARAVTDLWRRFEPELPSLDASAREQQPAIPAGRQGSRTGSRRVRLVGVTVSGLERPTGAQIGLFGGAGPPRAAGVGEPASTSWSPAAGPPVLHSPVDRVVDAINERFGEGTVAPARVLEPGAATVRRRRRPAPRS